MSETELVATLLERLDVVRQQFGEGEPEAVLAALGVRCESGEPPNGQDGLYIPAPRLVLINPSVRSRERRRFTGFHEATHVIIDDDESLRDALAEYCDDDETQQQVVEMLCNIGAAEFLAPRSRFVPFLKAHTTTLDCIAGITREFRGASLPVLAQQIARYVEPAAMVLICANRPIPVEGGFQRAQAHVEYAFTPPKWTSGRRRPKRYQVLEDDHPLSAVFDHMGTFRGETYYPHSSKKRVPCTCEAAWHASRERVIALLRDIPMA